ncbi:MAG: homoserine kinase [Desulfobacterales bacterium]|nr:MAG: homoserine kinase [Desulfobacterales bacterium]
MKHLPGIRKRAIVMEWVKVFAPATIGNIGPGFDVLGLAVRKLGDVVEARKIHSGVKISSVAYANPTFINLSTDPRENTAGIAARETLRILDVRGGVELRLKKGIPLGSGLGSSAASAAAAAFAVNHLYGNKLTKEELILAATRAEEVVSGGFFADNTAPGLLGGATLTRSCLPLDVTRIGSIKKLKIIVVTPEIVILTKEARKILPDKIPMKDFIFNMANTSLITAAFAKDDYALFARSLNDVVIEPIRSKLIQGFDQVKKNALKAGADGMTISGSGPTVFAITDGLSKARFIEDAMVRTFKQFGTKTFHMITAVDPEGARVIK